MPLSFDEIVKSKLLMVGFNKRLEKILPGTGKDQVSERILVPVHVFDFLDVEFH